MTLADNHQRVCETLRRLRQESYSLISTWALFESSNGYPMGVRREKLRQFINQNYEPVGIDHLQRLIVRDTILTLHRMIDVQGKISDLKRQSLTHVSRFLKQQDASTFLVTSARNWNPGLGLQNYNENLVRTLLSEVSPLLSEKSIIKDRNIGSVRSKISKLRSNELAHLLEGGSPQKPSLFEVREAVVLVVVLVKKCSLLFDGVDWDPKDQWHQSLKYAAQFWDRYEKGFNA
jgi:hypothetical protein